MGKAKFIFPILYIILFVSAVSAQETDIVPYLKQIEAGKKEAVREKLPELKSHNPNDPSVFFLEGVLTEEGRKAVSIYKEIIDKYPKSRYADASVYRVYSYYYALGLYKSAEKYLNMLKKDYPHSPYIKISEKKMPSRDEVAGEHVVVKENPPEKKEQLEEDSKRQEYKFTIQAGAFSDSGNAEALQKKFEDAGFSSQVKEKSVAGTTFHIVFVGRFMKREEADNFLDVINKRFNLDGRVVPTE